MTAEAHAAFQAARAAKRRREPSIPNTITFQPLGAPLSPRVEAEIRRALTPILNTPVQPDEMAQHLLQITGSDRYEYLTYTVTDRPQPTALQIGVREKTYGPPFLMVGLDLNNIDSTNFAVNLSGRVLQYGLVGVGSETRLDFVLGTTQHARVELVKPIGSTPLFVAPRVYFDRRGRNQFVDDVFVAEYRDQSNWFRPRRRQRFRTRCRDPAGLQHQRLQRADGESGRPSFQRSTDRSNLRTSIFSSTPRRARSCRLVDGGCGRYLRQFFAAPTASGQLEGVTFDSPQSFTSGEVQDVLVQARAKQDRPSVLHRRRRELVRR